MPTLQAARDSLTPVRQWRGLNAALRNSAEYIRLSRAVNFGNCYLHSRLHRIQTTERIAPRFDCLHIQTHQRSIRNVQVLKKISRSFAVIHRRATDKTEPG